mmetsp:Transcript_41360/g.88851  ORF Transcript_41360/g.88851 Transcript_41360/m.88851 type:complete len:181 (-) Transcript_41360:413-955(-)
MAKGVADAHVDMSAMLICFPTSGPLLMSLLMCPTVDARVLVADMLFQLPLRPGPQSGANATERLDFRVEAPPLLKSLMMCPTVDACVLVADMPVLLKFNILAEVRVKASSNGGNLCCSECRRWSGKVDRTDCLDGLGCGLSGDSVCEPTGSSSCCTGPSSGGAPWDTSYCKAFSDPSCAS